MPLGQALQRSRETVYHMMLVGPPDAGKTLLSRAVPGILPRLTLEEALEVTRIYSVADMLGDDTPLVAHRPFRAPHHTISHAGLVGGGRWPRPGEVSLAHRGVLFLDEMPEFGTRNLETLQQPFRALYLAVEPCLSGQMVGDLAQMNLTAQVDTDHKPGETASQRLSCRWTKLPDLGGPCMIEFVGWHCLLRGRSVVANLFYSDWVCQSTLPKM